jgi:hypothetical protein
LTKKQESLFHKAQWQTRLLVRVSIKRIINPKFIIYRKKFTGMLSFILYIKLMLEIVKWQNSPPFKTHFLYSIIYLLFAIVSSPFSQGLFSKAYNKNIFLYTSLWILIPRLSPGEKFARILATW